MNIDKEKLSPMMRKYLETKEEYPDCILFYRLGDFYEMFFDDALLASKVLDITLTGKACGLEERAPMCGVPYHSVSQYLTRMIEAGYKVAIGEQVEDPATAKGLVKREVVKVVTPGTLLEDDSLEKAKNNYLMVVYFQGKNATISYVDISTGELNITKIKSNKAKEEVARVSPSEIISNNEDFIEDIRSLANMANIYLNIGFNEDLLEESILKETFKEEYLKDLQINDDKDIISCLAIVMNYIRNTQMQSSNNISKINIYNPDNFMTLDLFTKVNLELVKTMRGSNKKGSLLNVLDCTSTPMGSRMLRKFIEQPLVDKEKIQRRLDITEEIYSNYILRDELKSALSNIFDLERICAKVAYDRVMPKDLLNLKNSISALGPIIEALNISRANILSEFRDNIDPLDDLFNLIDKSILETPSNTIKDGNIIKSQYSNELYDLRDISNNGANMIAQIEKNEKENTGAKTLKIGYNKVFGYYIEITKVALLQANLSDKYIRKQTLVNAERFITPELKEIEDKIINAEDKIKDLEYRLYKEIRNNIFKNIERIQRVANLIAELDVYVSNAIVADKNSYVKPQINTESIMLVKDGRHPVIEQIMGRESFISNDTNINRDNTISIITGPNMSGKSTYMRQTALIALMAHLGSFVPASYANIPLLDRIFTRVGASDDLSQGQSTFMVEMSEVSQILKNASKNSLIILDEIGRGTSTYDGISLAWSIVEYIQKNIGAKTLFATHYHELTDLENQFDGIKNYSVEVKEEKEEILFLRKIVPCAADRSYGIYVAKLAQLPDNVLNRADEILSELEKKHIENQSSIKKVIADNNRNSIQENQLTFDMINHKNDDKEKEFLNEVANIDFMNSTPMDIMNKMFELQKKAKELICQE
ncbi:DNA mismatch repair protein MutS [Peptostreptococcus equinus]|uniref:DNA mismatch repair protein MutS n=1 Tax=Peptostreptococcus equinus TaxID=3003601 RepID=A0ABY7JTJ0_9FIRM|nr:DNA mismatch repair protein MutS [Peptostreptococcus sp. CBA3647]WAW15809.1 DNA mismatch repair protein MutS [Peptostreptococcus sp. CBA3647]